ncbi:hypothetical protein BN2475_490062 [Paraburkholderia ribeironis]|uniref:Uncharacterized protein n=1 Tax=Paraburkholderia ribeironis TaxID=1247936 RepID=A0A1N7SCY1_9BURK|nr:hypothetical protein BN2475_490062 [Paraburkholderia ribeironis]
MRGERLGRWHGGLWIAVDEGRAGALRTFVAGICQGRAAVRAREGFCAALRYGETLSGKLRVSEKRDPCG